MEMGWLLNRSLGWCLSKVDDAAWLEFFIVLNTYLHIGLYNTSSSSL
jgi:hypothetical protein